MSKIKSKTRQRIMRLFHQGCVEYDMLRDGDCILVAISGGKDSLVMLDLLAAQSKLYKPDIRIEAVHVVMDNIPYESDATYLQAYCQERGVRFQVLHTSFDEQTNGHRPKCFLCSWQRRKMLLTYATENKFNKVALGHHQDDIIVTLLMNQTFEGSMQTMPPSLKMEHYPVTIIRPMCMVPESLVIEMAKELDIRKQKTPCPYETVTHRTTMTRIFKELQAINPEARYSLWSAMKNVHHDLLP